MMPVELDRKLKLHEYNKNILPEGGCMINPVKNIYFINVSIIILFLSIFVSCASCPKKGILSQERVDFEKDPFAYDSSGNPAAKSVLLVADNQFNNLYSNPDPLRSKLMDKKVKVAVRPPQLDLFSKDMLQWILNEHGKNKYIIHLGDALNIACQSEWDRFTNTMTASNVHKGWVIIPGSHDSCYYGNVEPNKLDKNNWKKACSMETTLFKTGIISDKNIFIRNYLSSLIKQHNAFPGDFTYTDGDFNGYTKNTVADWKSSVNNSFLKRIAFRYSDGNQQDSFIMQEIDLSLDNQNNVFAILLDTTDYSDWPIEPVLTGAVGSISKEQLNIADKWIADLKNGNNKSIKYFLIGHSPMNEIYDLNVPKWISDKVEAKDGFLCYISAHTHSGWIKKGKSIIKRNEFFEMNVGSTTDWSDTKSYNAIAARTLTLRNEKVYSERIFIKSTDKINSNDKSDYAGNVQRCYACYKDNKYGIYDYSIDALLLTYVRLFQDLGVSDRNDVKDLITGANDLLNTACIDKPIPSGFKEDFFIGGIKECYENKLVYIRQMERKDEELRQNNNIYKDARLLYGVCQTIRASKAEFER